MLAVMGNVAPRMTDAQISRALRLHLPEHAQAGLRERILDATETTSQPDSAASLRATASKSSSVPITQPPPCR